MNEIHETLPGGTIVAWYAKSDRVPQHWAVCDGTNGTPDLRGRFLRGVAALADVGPDGTNPDAKQSTTNATTARNHKCPDNGPDDFLVLGFGYTHEVPLPPHFHIIFIMKSP